MKYIPLCFLGLLILLGHPIGLVIYCALGYYQFMVRKRSVIRLPLKVYRKFDSLMPTSMKNNVGYIKVTSVQSNLEKVCLTEGCCNWGNEDRNLAEEGPGRVQSNPAPSRVEVLGGGVSIGGASFSQPSNNQNRVSNINI